MNRLITEAATIAIVVFALFGLKAIHPALSWTVAAFGLGWCLGGLFSARRGSSNG